MKQINSYIIIGFIILGIIFVIGSLFTDANPEIDQEGAFGQSDFRY